MSGPHAPRDPTELATGSSDPHPVIGRVAVLEAPTAPVAMDTPIEVPAKIGRFMVLDCLGAGGMGVVYAAYDPELDRKVAVKLMRPEKSTGSSGSAGPRLLREAQALAKLSHPNVVSVYDVGTFGDEVFLAMELVDGVTLRKWTADGDRSWRELLEVFMAAGHGLAAAHAAGLVHRDFKPENVLLGKDGRVRILDFGLARRRSESEIGPSPATERSQDLAEMATRAGVVHGTPAYMAPEQHAAIRTDARSDQYSFCLSLYEALYGGRPFSGHNVTELFQSKLRPPTDPPRSRVPRWLGRVALRGLSPQSDERFPDMDALLAALADDPGARRRKWGGIGAVALALLGGVVVYSEVQDRAAQQCEDAQRRVSALWNADRKRELEAAFMGVGQVWAEDTVRTVEQRLDEFADGWSTLQHEVCVATHVRGEQSEELLHVRLACLERRYQEFGALVDLFVAADAGVVEHAVRAASNLHQPEQCADVQALTDEIQPPADPEIEQQVEDLRADLAKVKALEDAGKYADAVDFVGPIAQRARRVDYQPAFAEVMLRAGVVHDRAGDYETARELLVAAFFAARESRSHEVAANAASALVTVVGDKQAKPDQGRMWARHARVEVQRIGVGSVAEATLLSNLGKLMYGHTKSFEEAREHHERAFEIRSEVFGAEHPQTVQSLHDIGVGFYHQERYADALDRLHRALELWEQVLGPAHPQLGESLLIIGNVHSFLKQPDEALKRYRRALAVWEGALGSRHPRVSAPLHNIGEVLDRGGRPSEALPYYQRSFAIAEAAYGPTHPLLLQSLEYSAKVLIALRRFEDAVGHYRRALTIREQSFGDMHASVGSLHCKLGDALAGAGAPNEALAHYRRGLEILPKQASCLAGLR